jgi:hypothetical protein
MKLFVAALVAAVPATALHAQTMPVSTFLTKADALKKKGPLALLSSDLGVLKQEVNNSAQAYAADVRTARKAGKLTHSCPPEGGSLSMNSDELLAHLNSIPARQRGMSIKAAFYGLMKKKFPCRR